ncbi:hypothetical protein GCM10012284_47920 [Mangrovihabitans endophyticus]|uniref:Uncharacterized protein n=1 Tax=Mangrovihabitans endophyticus TaxID=1751298 RepID=A0A8J3C4D5_9ACTN|nr:hypothetical protein GCM10012284_47920 [Mangrovihabitans endophyticus]
MCEPVRRRRKGSCSAYRFQSQCAPNSVSPAAGADPDNPGDGGADPGGGTDPDGGADPDGAGGGVGSPPVHPAARRRSSAVAAAAQGRSPVEAAQGRSPVEAAQGRSPVEAARGRSPVIRMLTGTPAP